MAKTNRYSAIIESIFFSGYEKGVRKIEFKRTDLESTAKKLKIPLPKNLGDVIYSIRYRTELPKKVIQTQPEGMEWIIEGRGRSKYCFKLVKINRIKPNPDLLEIKIPDSTPEVVNSYSLSDEQALLAKVRYNRLIDIFLGIATYSLQNHLRTTVAELGQVEIDEIYVGIDKKGAHYIIPVQAKGGTDQLSAVQAKQDLACCAEKFPSLICRPLSAKFIEENLIALFELCLDGGMIRVIEEKHYRLVASDAISADDLVRYSK